VRFVAWNCCERFDRNYLHLRDLDFDVAVVCECGPFDPGLGEAREVTAVLKLAVDQPGQTKQIGVLARDPWRVEELPLVEDQPWLLCARVTGPLDFTVLAVWALGPEWVEGRLSYATQTGRVVAQALPAVDGPVVVAGDLNAPILSSSTSTRLHADNVDRLLAGGLMSAFTAARGEADPLTEPTYFHRWNAAQPFHIDHVFLPKEWISGIELSIGTYEEWVATKRSDHVPIVVDLSPPVTSGTGVRIPVSVSLLT
jgi:endonuclease/exonuclease/phosphatase (EEP) superfamily protein YafD